MFGSKRAESMRLNLERRRRLLDEAIDLGYVPINKRIPAEKTLTTYISENRKAKIIFKKYPALKVPRDYRVTITF
ncbi:MAG: hypothetical protein P4L61_01010 [Candidatus Pacebacteria bacterium]|nr:hypothetical protein [Candidatus Paceibacterota bacterium]